MTFLKALYTLSIALLVLAFVVFGIASFPAPQPPDVPPELANIGESPTEEQQELLAEQSERQQAFQEQLSLYNQVVSIGIIGVAVVLLAASVMWLRRIPVIGEGVTLGAVFTLLYGLYFAYTIAAGLGTFIGVAVGLVILCVLVYWRIVHAKDAPGGNPEQGRQPPPQEEARDSVRIGGEKE